MKTQLFDLLLSWYDRNARTLPWRVNTDPYRVWISEIMLQQTKVDTVIPYYIRFLEAFPNIASLANADEMVLLKLWEGLGYYSRAKNLQSTAQIITKDYNGHFPADPIILMKLPGIGPYTAGAIASISFGKKIAAVDGNVLRVFARLFASQENISKKEGKKVVTDLVDAYLPDTRNGDFNQALMELGALVCIPNGKPLCLTCPLASICQAHINQLTDLIPVKSQSKKRETEEKTFLLFVAGENILIQQRQEGLLADLWEFIRYDAFLSVEDVINECIKLGVAQYKINPLPDRKHIFTHKEWMMKGFIIEVDQLPMIPKTVSVSIPDLTNQYTLPIALHSYRWYLLQTKK